jgi:hypothetical protein
VRIDATVGVNATVRAFVYVLLVFALTLQQFAPPGLMAGATVGHTIVLCSVGGTRTVTVDADGKPIPQEQDHKCPMCVCFQNAHAPTTPAIVAIAASLPTYLSVAPLLHRPYTPPYMLYESTGPPRVHA